MPLRSVWLLSLISSLKIPVVKRPATTETPVRRFVVQKHTSRSPHFDFRLERDGVLKSWAVPKGVPDEIGIRRLAIQVDDHDLEFADFEGDIPIGEYGTGSIEIWDRGTYESHVWTDQCISFTLRGEKLCGLYNLIRFHHGKEREWLLFKRRESRHT